MQEIKEVTTIWLTILTHEIWDRINTSWNHILMTNTVIRNMNGTNYSIHFTKIMKAGRDAKLISAFSIIFFIKCSLDIWFEISK